MKTYALLFSTDEYTREELDKMSNEDKYSLANIASNFGYDEADVLTLDEFSQKVNDDRISLEHSWLYFVTI